MVGRRGRVRRIELVGGIARSLLRRRWTFSRKTLMIGDFVLFYFYCRIYRYLVVIDALFSSKKRRKQ